jgi:hypothetical protein
MQIGGHQYIIRKTNALPPACLQVVTRSITGKALPFEDLDQIANKLAVGKQTWLSSWALSFVHSQWSSMSP